MNVAHTIRNFLKNKSGQISVATCLSAFPILGAVGLSVDYSAIAASKVNLQNQADTEALEARNGSWISDTVYQVNKSKSYNTYFMGIMGYSTVNISVTAQAKSKDPVLSFDPNTIIPLNGNAWDYNIAGFYCYNAETNKRSLLTDMSDNRNGYFNVYRTDCQTGETVEFYLKNYTYYKRNGSNYERTQVDAPCTTDSAGICDRHYFFTDSGSKSNINSGGAITLSAETESIICPTISSCIYPACYYTDKYWCLNFEQYGGPIPYGINRTPKRQAERCEPGKFIFYGWEDTPRSRTTAIGQPTDYGAAYDADYNDYGIIMACPDFKNKKGQSVYLIR